MTDSSRSVPAGVHWIRLCAGVLLLMVGWGGTHASAQPRPDVASWVEPDTIVSGEPFIFNVTASTPAHREVWFPEASADSSVFGPLTVVRRSKVYSRPVGVMYAIDSVAYTVTVEARDSVQIPSIPVRVDAAADTVVSRTQPLTIPVVTRGAPSMLSGGEAAPGPMEAVGWGLLGVVVIAGLGGGLYVWRRDEATSPTDSASAVLDAAESDRSPSTAARQKLSALEARTETGDVESVYVTLSEVIQGYLARRFDMAARESTTSELLASLREHEAVPAPARERLQVVLEEADLVKFAGRRPEVSTAHEHLLAVRVALDAIENGEVDGGGGDCR